MTMDVSSVKLQALANKLLEQDEDKVITESELQSFVASNDDELTALNIDAIDAMDELRDILKDSMETTNDTDTATTTENTSSSNSAGGDDFDEKYNAILAQIDEYNKLIEGYDLQINQLTKDTQSLKTELDEAINLYNKQEAEIVKENKYLEETINDINSTKENLESDVENQQKRAVWTALADYNPERDGDWDSYLQKTCENTVYSPLASKLSSLVNESKVSVSDIQSIASKMKQAGESVSTLSDKITSNTSNITNLTQLKANTTTALEKAQQDLNDCILSLVSCEEMKLVEENNINLKETLCDGSPRYIFAKGKEDGKYHIYDMGAERPGASLARQYGSGSCSTKDLANNLLNGNTGGARYPGTDIVPMGNGYIKNLSDVAEGQGEKVYWLSECGAGSKNCCYCTSSPLEFDLEGDGHKLDTSKTVKFDIDGDGTLDDINDSNDAVLVFDKDGDGISGKDGSEMFGDNTDLDGDGKADGYKNGFEALAALAEKEGLVNGADDTTLDENDLKILEDKYGLKMKTGGYNSEAKSLSEIGITEINVSNSKVSDKKQFDSFGNEIQTQEGATFKINGEEREYADLWHRKYDSDDAGSTSGSLSFDLNKIGNFAANAKSSVNSKTSEMLSKSRINTSLSNSTSSKALKDTNNILDENFWSGNTDGENIFAKHNNEVKQEEEQAKLDEQAKLEEEKKKEELEEDN